MKASNLFRDSLGPKLLLVSHLQINGPQMGKKRAENVASNIPDISKLRVKCGLNFYLNKRLHIPGRNPKFRKSFFHKKQKFFLRFVLVSCSFHVSLTKKVIWCGTQRTRMVFNVFPLPNCHVIPVHSKTTVV